MQKKKKRKLKKGYRILRAFYIALVVIAAMLVVGYGIYKFAFPAPEIPAHPASAAAQEGVAPGYTDTGNHQRREQAYTFLLAARDQESGNADSIMVVTYDVPNQKVGMLSIPRDTMVNQKSPKINAAYHEGVENLRETVSDLVGFPLDFYIALDMEGFVALVDAVDGVDFNIPVYMYYDDPAQDLHIHYEPGVQHLNGQQAMEVCRFRHNADGTGYPQGDVQRAQTTQELMITVAKKVVSWSNLPKVNAFMDIFTQYVNTNLTRSNLAYFAGKGLSLNLNQDVTMGTLPGDGSVTYHGTKYCYELYPEESLAMINQIVNPYTTSLAESDVNIFQAP